MADETKKKILKTIGEAAAVVSPGAKLAKTLAELRNKEKKADFQKGDYSDIETDEKRYKDSDRSQLKSVKMPELEEEDNSISNKKIKKFLEKKDNKVKKTAKNLGELQGAKPGIDKPTGKIQAFKSGGRVNFKGGGCAIRGLKKNAYGKNS